MLQDRYVQARQRALDAGDQEAAQKIEAFMPQLTEQPQEGQTPTEEPSALKNVGKTADEFVRGLADTLTFGYADEIAAAADQAVRGTPLAGLAQTQAPSYEESLSQQRQRDTEGGGARLTGQIVGGVAPTVGVVRAASGATRLARAGAGAGTGAIQGGLYGTGSAEGGLSDRLAGGAVGAAIGAPLGGAVSAIVPLTKTQQVNRFVNQAGGEDLAKVDAEIVRRGQEILSDPLRKVSGKAKDLRASDANQMVRDSFKREALDVLKKLPTGFPNRAALIEKVSQGRALTPAERTILGQDPVGRLVIPSIEAMQRVDVLTGPQASAGGARELARNVAGYVLPEKLARGVSALFGKRQTRENVISNLINRQGQAASLVAQRLGDAPTTASIKELTELAAQASQKADAEKAAKAVSRTRTAEEGAAIRAEREAKKLADQEAKKAAELRQNLAVTQSEDPTYLLGVSNPLGAPRNKEQMAEFSKLLRQQMEARAAREELTRQSKSLFPDDPKLAQNLSETMAKDPTYLLRTEGGGVPRNPQEMSEFSKLLRQQMLAREGVEKVTTDKQIAQELANKVSVDNWSKGVTGSGGIQGKMTEYTGLKDKQLIDVLDELSNTRPEFSPYIQTIRESGKIPSTKLLGQIQDEVRRVAIEKGLDVSPAALKNASIDVGVKGVTGVPQEFFKRASNLVSGLDDQTIQTIVGRSQSASGEAIAKPRAYATGVIAKLLNDKAQQRAISNADKALMDALGL
jgi:hypothetical protein